jgi:hypothetical protein
MGGRQEAIVRLCACARVDARWGLGGGWAVGGFGWGGGWPTKGVGGVGSQGRAGRGRVGERRTACGGDGGGLRVRAGEKISVGKLATRRQPRCQINMPGRAI